MLTFIKLGFNVEIRCFTLDYLILICFCGHKVRGMMYYRRALMLQSFLERRGLGGTWFFNFFFAVFPSRHDCNRQFYFFGIVDDVSLTNMPRGFEASPEARAQADLKFTYVVSCQIYGQQKQQKKPEATDIALLLQR